MIFSLFLCGLQGWAPMGAERFDLLNLTSSFKYLNMLTNIGGKREERENSSAAYFTPSGQGPRAKVSRPLYLSPAIAPLATLSASSGE